jgi:hypothetical protein
MRFEPHPLMSLMGYAAYAAFAGKYSFLILSDDGGKTWRCSWQDQVKGGSASNTMEGPFKSRDQAEARCRAIYKSLQRKN